MTVHLGDEAPDFVAETTQGEIRFREWKRGRWALLVSHPADFTPVCTTELAALASLWSDFDERGASVIAVSVDPLDAHFHWLNDIEGLAGAPVKFPIAADANRWITNLYGMIHPRSGRDAVRVAVLIDPADLVRLVLAYPACTGRDFGELLRVLDSLQLADRYGVATPAGWRRGQDVLIPTDVSPAEAEERFPKGIRASTAYLRFTPQPDVDTGGEGQEAAAPEAK